MLWITSQDFLVYPTTGSLYLLSKLLLPSPCLPANTNLFSVLISFFYPTLISVIIQDLSFFNVFHSAHALKVPPCRCRRSRCLLFSAACCAAACVWTHAAALSIIRWWTPSWFHVLTTVHRMQRTWGVVRIFSWEWFHLFQINPGRPCLIVLHTYCVFTNCGSVVTLLCVTIFWAPFSISICSCVSVSHSGNACNFQTFHYYHTYYGDSNWWSLMWLL